MKRAILCSILAFAFSSFSFSKPAHDSATYFLRGRYDTRSQLAEESSRLGDGRMLAAAANLDTVKDRTSVEPLLISYNPRIPRTLRQEDAAQAIARKKIADFQATFDPQMMKAAGLTQAEAERMRKIYAFQISNDYTARRLLKTEFKDLGKEYYKVWLEQGDGMVHQLINRAKGKLAGYSPEVLDLLEVIQNESSKLEMKAPMDFDIGVLTKTREKAREILKKIGGPAAVAKFHEELEKALQEAYSELFGSLGGTGRLNPARAFITATTAWHPEAYADAQVLKQGGVAGKDLVQQTVDVSKWKVAKCRKDFADGVLTVEEAMEEAMRGTSKDLKKVENVFSHIEKITGVTPKFSAEQEAIIEVLRKVESMEMSAAAANAEIMRISGGRFNAFSACDNLMDIMEATWKNRPRKPQEWFLSLFAQFLGDRDYEKSFQALLEGTADDLPASAKKIVEELEVAAKTRALSIRGGTLEQFFDDFTKDFPNYKICTKPGDESLQQIIKQLESGAAGEDLIAIFGKEQADRMRKVRELMTEGVKAQIKVRYSKNKFLLWDLDKNGRVLLGDPAVSTLGIDAGVGLAMAFFQTASIMERGLTPEEESRQILNAWGTSLPILGDIAQGLIEGIEGYYEADKAKIFKAGAWLAIGAAGFVPGAQAPALVLGLSLAAFEVGSSYFDIRKDKDLLEAWIASGKWDEKLGTLKGLTDAKDKDHEVSFEGIITNGNVGYKAGLADFSIRDSVYIYAERNGLDNLEKLQSYLRALKVLYPAFSFKETLREPLRTGKPLFGAAIGEAGGNPSKSVEMLMFVRAKGIADAEVNRAAQSIQAQVEAEYQARNRVGDADRIFKELEALGKRLNLPLYENVHSVNYSFGSFVTEGLKTPWVRESIPRRRVQLAEKYLNGYLEIEKSLKTIRVVFERAGVKIPSFNLSGFLEIDAPRIRDLETAYINRVMRETGLDVQKIHREASGDAAYVFNPNQPDPCDAELFRQLANIMVRIVESDDRKLLLEQRTGKKTAAEASRDESLRKAQEATKGMRTESLVTIPIAIWGSLCENFEAAYAWTNVRWEGSEVYEEAIAAQTDRITKLKKEYADAIAKGSTLMGECLANTPEASIQLSKSEPEEGETITARLVLTKGKTPKDGKWQWSAAGGLQVQSAAGEQTGIVANGSGTLTATLIAGTKELTRLRAVVTVKPKAEAKGEDKKDSPKTPLPEAVAVKFSGTVSANWEGGNTPQGFVLRRKPAKIKGPCGWDSSVSASIEARFAQAAKPKDAAEASSIAETRFKARRQGDTPNDPAVGLFMAGGHEGVSAFSMGDYQGAIADFAIWMRRGSWGEGYTGSYFGANGDGNLVKQGGVISFSYHVNGGGCWDNSDRAYLVTQGAAAQEEARAILASLRLDDKGLLTSKPYDGPKYDGSDLAKVMLVPSSIDRLKVGDTVKFEAVVENAKPEDSPFAYNWGGTFDGTPETSKKSNTVRIKPTKPGKYSVNVAVDGARFGLGSASVDYRVADYRVKIERVEAANKPPVVGSNNGFKATLTVDGAAAAANFIYRWEPSTELNWSPSESEQAQAKAVFTKPGKTKVWVVVLEKKGEVLTTVAESDRLELDVTNPALKIMFAPETAVVGAQVKASVKTTPADIKDIDFRWELSSNAQLLNESQDAREITFIAKDTNPVQVTTRARVPVSGEDLGEATAKFAAKKFDVKVTVLGPQGPKPQVWKEGVGLVTVENAIAVHQNVTMRAEVSPQVEGIDFRYEWTVNEDSHLVGGGTSNEARFNRSQTGTCVATVVVRDQNGLELGRGSGTFSATISEEMMSGGGKKKEAGDKITKAKEIVRKGQLEEAIALADQAAAIDPVTTEAKSLAGQWTRERDTCLAQIEKAKQLMREGRYSEASNAMVVAKNLHGLYKPVVDMDAQLNAEWRSWDSKIQNDIGLIREANNRREFKRASDLAAKRRAEGKIGPYEQSLADQEQWAHKGESEKEQMRQILRAGEEKVKQYDYTGALKDFERGFANFNNLWAASDPEPAFYYKLRDAAIAKNKRISELMGAISDVARNPNARPDLIETNIKNADEVLTLQPTNTDARRYREMLAARLSGRSSKTSAATLVKQGEDFYEKNNYQQAVDVFNKALEADPNSAAAYAGRCLARRGLQDNAGALADCSRALQLDPNNVDAYRGRSMVKRTQNNLQGALTDANRAVDLAPSNYRAYLTRGLAREELNDLAGALADYSRSIQINPDYAMSYYYRGRVRYESKDYTGAITDYDRSIQINPDYAMSYFNRGRARYATKDYPGALVDYDRYISMNATDSAAFNNRGLVKEHLGDTAGAIADFEKAISLTPNYETAKKNLANLRAKLVGTKTETPPNPPVKPVDSTSSARSISGRWKMVVGKYNAVFALQQSGSRLTGSVKESSTGVYGELEGTVEGRRVRLTRRWSSGLQTYDLLLDASFNRMSGTFDGTRDITAGTDVQFERENVVPSPPPMPTPRATPEPTPSPSKRPGWRTTASGYPDIAGEWIEASGYPSNGSPITITQSGATIVAVGRYAIGTKKISYRIDGTLTRDGVITGRLVHTEGVSPGSSGFAQDRRMTLTPDGNNLDISTASVGGGGAHQLKWRRAAPTSTKTTPPANPINIGSPPTKPPGSSEVDLFNSMNVYGVGNQPTAPATFTIRQPHVITSVMTYHWNNGRGTRAGTIELRDANGRTYGPWSVTGTPGQGGVPNVNWTCAPNIEIPAGAYTIIDSEPSTWSQNAQSRGRGMAVVKGYPIDSTPQPTPVSATPKRVEGEWEISRSGFVGEFDANDEIPTGDVLVISGAGASLQAKILFSGRNVWVRLTNVTFDGAILRFTRPEEEYFEWKQNYEGHMVGNRLQGTLKSFSIPFPNNKPQVQKWWGDKKR